MLLNIDYQKKNCYLIVTICNTYYLKCVTGNKQELLYFTIMHRTKQLRNLFDHFFKRSLFLNEYILINVAFIKDGVVIYNKLTNKFPS